MLGRRAPGGSCTLRYAETRACMYDIKLQHLGGGADASGVRRLDPETLAAARLYRAILSACDVHHQNAKRRGLLLCRDPNAPVALCGDSSYSATKTRILAG